jgi:ABC-2 type transport system ATP-binding protein
MEQAFRHCVIEAQERGQAVFLSSHVLSEVEALCDRLALLRAGRLAESGTMADLRQLSALTVQASFAGPVPDISRVPGVTSVTADSHSVRCQVQGSVAPLLEVLARAGATRLLSREPSLEELFLGLYGEHEQPRQVAAR